MTVRDPEEEPMIRQRLALALVGALATVAVAVPISSADIEAELAPGDTVEFIVPDGTPVVLPRTG